MSDNQPSPDRTIPIGGPRRRILTTKRIITVGGGLGLMLFVLYVTRNTATVSQDDTMVVPAAAHIVAWQPKKQEPVQIETVAASQPQIAQERKAQLTQQERPTSSPPQPAMVAFSLPPPRQAPTSPANGAEGQSGSTNVMFKGVSLPGVKAGLMGDDSLTLMPGLIRCILIDDIINGGPFQCALPGPVKSPMGVPLMDRDTVITGHTDNNVSGGADRINGYGVTAWTPTHPPCGVPLSNGPAADALGAAGMPASVDHYYWQRFGPAIALSLTDSLFGLLQSSMNGGHNNTYLSLNTGSVSSLASEVLRSQMNEYKPTGKGHRGDAITIWTTDPIRFDDCYQLVSRQ